MVSHITHRDIKIKQTQDTNTRIYDAYICITVHRMDTEGYALVNSENI